MRRIRVIPILLLSQGKLVKTVQFNTPKATYIGDVINAVKIFNDKEVDEIVVLDINASAQKQTPNFNFIEQFAGECFMPLGYGGGITSLDDAKKVFAKGAEKVVLNSILTTKPELITEIAQIYGSQSIIASIDVKKNWLGKYQIYTHNGSKLHNVKLLDWVKEVEDRGAGEIMINAIDKDGTMQGYDLALIQKISENTTLPVIACGGAGNIEDFEKAIVAGKASAVAAGSMFVFNGKLRGVLISYPSQQNLVENLYKKCM